MPKDHPLRRVKDLADGALALLSPTFAKMYSGTGRTERKNNPANPADREDAPQGMVTQLRGGVEW